MTLDRTGEEIPEDVEPEEHICRGGWLDPDGDHPKPCLICRPHLDPAKLRYRAGVDPYPPAEPQEAS